MALFIERPANAKCTKLVFAIKRLENGMAKYICDFLGTTSFRKSAEKEEVEKFVYQFLLKIDGFYFEHNAEEFSFYVKNISLNKIKTGAEMAAKNKREVSIHQYWNRALS